MVNDKEMVNKVETIKEKVKIVFNKTEALTAKLKALQAENQNLATQVKLASSQEEQVILKAAVVKKEKELTTEINDLLNNKNKKIATIIENSANFFTDDNFYISANNYDGKESQFSDIFLGKKSTVQHLNEYTITQRITVENFINKMLKEHIIEKIKHKYPEQVIDFKKDVVVTINNLQATDFLEGHNLKVKTQIGKENKIADVFIFIVKVKYQYDIATQIKLLDAILKPAIPKALWQDRAKTHYQLLNRSADEYDKISKEVEKVMPLNWLLAETDFALAIAAELIAASYWTCFYAKWWGLWGNNYGAWQSYNVIPNWKEEIGTNSKNITQVQKLFDLKQGYFNEIFKVIEKRLFDNGIICQVKKKTILDRSSLPFGLGVGNLNFYNSIATQTIKKFDATKRQFFVQVNFDVLINKKIIEYPGVVLLLSDILRLYN